MSALSDALETSLLNHLLRATAYTPATALHFGLFLTDPGESGVSGEVSGGSYARVAVTNNSTSFGLASNIAGKSNAIDIVFPEATAAWGTPKFWAVYETPTSFTGTTTSGNATIASVADTSAIKVGMALSGTGIAAGATVVSIVLNTSVTMSLVATASGTVSIAGEQMLVHGALLSPRYVATGDTPKIAAGAMSVSFGSLTGIGLTDYAKSKLLDLVFGAYAFTPPTTVYAAVATGLTTAGFTEWTDSSYTRQAVTFGAPSGGVSSNSGVITMSGAVVSYIGPLSHFQLLDSATVGNALLSGPLSSARTIPVGDSCKFAIGSISCTLQ